MDLSARKRVWRLQLRILRLKGRLAMVRLRLGWVEAHLRALHATESDTQFALRHFYSRRRAVLSSLDELEALCDFEGE